MVELPLGRRLHLNHAHRLHHRHQDTGLGNLLQRHRLVEGQLDDRPHAVLALGRQLLEYGGKCWARREYRALVLT